MVTKYLGWIVMFHFVQLVRGDCREYDIREPANISDYSCAFYQVREAGFNVCGWKCSQEEFCYHFAVNDDKCYLCFGCSGQNQSSSTQINALPEAVGTVYQKQEMRPSAEKYLIQSEVPQNHSLATQFCKDQGAKMLILENKEELDLVTCLLLQKGTLDVCGGIWTGLYRSDNLWLWQGTENEVDDELWLSPYGPNDTPDRSCGELYWTNEDDSGVKLGVSDYKCHVEECFICEFY